MSTKLKNFFSNKNKTEQNVAESIKKQESKKTLVDLIDGCINIVRNDDKITVSYHCGVEGAIRKVGWFVVTKENCKVFELKMDYRGRDIYGGDFTTYTLWVQNDFFRAKDFNEQWKANTLLKLLNKKYKQQRKTTPVQLDLLGEQQRLNAAVKFITQYTK